MYDLCLVYDIWNQFLINDAEAVVNFVVIAVFDGILAMRTNQ